jgi:cysteine desulfurase
LKRIYLDNAATTRMDEKVLEAMTPYFLEYYGNPSSIHSFGQEAYKAISSAREKVAEIIGVEPDEIIFTSGGTESDNLAIKGVAFANRRKGNHIITSEIEHHAVLASCDFLKRKGFKISLAKVNKNGVVDPKEIRDLITDKTILISIMHANNEIGTIQPIAEIGAIAREHDIYFHTDAVQTFGHIDARQPRLNYDLLSLSGHKLYGPKGIGALYIKRGTRIFPEMHGGGQEMGLRSSTYNVAGIVGLAAACTLASKEMDESPKKLARLRDLLIRGVLDNLEESYLNGDPIYRLPNNANFVIRYIEGESVVLNLDFKGIACSTGSACSSASSQPSHVLAAIGVSRQDAHSSLRFTLGKDTDEKQIMHTVSTIIEVVKKLRAISPVYDNIKNR